MSRRGMLGKQGKALSWAAGKSAGAFFADICHDRNEAKRRGDRMVALAFEQITVWLDDLAPEAGAFPHALEWAERLCVPLKAFAPTVRAAEVAWPVRLVGDRSANRHADTGGPSAQGAEVLQACEAACQRRGISWAAYRLQGAVDFGVERFLRPLCLSVFSTVVPPPVMAGLLERSAHCPEAPFLISPPSWHPVCRILVINRGQDGNNCFLDAVAEVCRAFAVSPVVLTVGRTERDVQARQQLAEARLASHHLPADFDCVVGCDPAAAAAAVARWRRCSHVFVQRPRPGSWWGRFRDDLPGQLLGLSPSLSVLCLPEMGLPAALRQRDCPAPAPGVAWGIT